MKKLKKMADYIDITGEELLYYCDTFDVDYAEVLKLIMEQLGPDAIIDILFQEDDMLVQQFIEVLVDNSDVLDHIMELLFTEEQLEEIQNEE